jgi:predicted CXXCH cytochrome family protein
VSCHRDTHRGQLGGNCTSCHSQNSWKAVANFNHQLTRFPLTGLHAKVACERCHMNAQGAAARYKDIPFANCSDCHRDPHSGSFQSTCAQCHSPSGWQTTRVLVSTNFDHSRTRYPLTGRHAPLPCKSCHKTSNFNVPVASARCTDCHADKHSKQFLRRADRGDCIGCHTVSGFKPSTFTVAAHSQTRYPLMGKHAKVACDKCHAAKGEATNYYPQYGSCLNCHADVHQGQFKQRYLDKCESCHRVEGFAPSTFTLVQHREARFALAGAHGAVACLDCHKADGSRNSHRYVFADMSCTGCHSDPHGLAKEKENCETCHSQVSWVSVRTFDHNETRFTLLGAHRSVACSGCHKAEADKVSTTKRLSFGDTPRACSSCHEDVHGAQFARLNGGADCASCHQSSRWKPARFNHDTTAFPLDGRHRAVPCASCHKQRTEVRGRQVLIYRETPKECARCH